MTNIEQSRHRQLGPYVVVSEMGGGGTGTVVKGRHGLSGQLAAIKFARDTSRLQRIFLRKEISILARLQRQAQGAVVQLFEHGVTDGLLWYAMEIVDGFDVARLKNRVWSSGWPDTVSRTTIQTLRPDDANVESSDPERFSFRRPEQMPRIRKLAGAGNLERILLLIRDIAGALALVHNEGVMHGDVSPRNVFVRGDGRVVLMDFGTAVQVFTDGRAREEAQEQGFFHGTPGFMAPEQILRQPLDARADLYALGCILYDLVTGSPVFDDDNTTALLHHHLHSVPRPPSSLVDGVPNQLDQLVLQLLTKDPRRRMGYAHDVVATLDDLLGVEPRRPLKPAAHLYRPLLRGRDGVLEELSGELEEVKRSGARYVLVSGESGIGRTRVMNELGIRARTQGFDVVVGSCSSALVETDSSLPLRPALQAFTPFLQRLNDRCQLDKSLSFRTEIGGALTSLLPYEKSLASLVEEGHELTNDLPPTLATERVFRGLAECLRYVSRTQPLLLMLDDLDVADELTIAFLRSRHLDLLHDAPILLVASHRDGLADDASTPLAPRHNPRRIRLARLDKDTVGEIAKDMMAAPLLPPGLPEFLFKQSEGNPFFVAEHLRAAVDRGILRRDRQGRWQAPELVQLTTGDVDTAEFPASLQEWVDSRLNRLPASVLPILDLAAILGRQFSSDILEQLVQSSHPTAPIDASVVLGDLVHFGILEEVSTGRYRFVHEKFRQAREVAIPPQERRAIHRIAADTLERDAIATESAAERDAEIGLHWAKASEPTRALPLLERAARRSEAIYATAQAIELYRFAWRQTTTSTGTDSGELSSKGAAIAEALADVLAKAARHSEAREYYEAAARCLPVAERVDRVRILRKRSNSFVTCHAYDLAQTSLSEAASLLGPLDELTTPAELNEWIEIKQNEFLRLYFARCTGPATEGLVAALRQVVELHATPRQRSFFYQCAANDLLSRGRYRYSEEAVQLSRRAVEVALDTQKTAPDANLARFVLAFSLILGEEAASREAVTLLETTSAEAARVDDLTLASRALAYLAVAHRRCGEVDKTEFAAKPALRAAEAAGSRPYAGAACGALSWVAWRRGKMREAVEHIREANEHWQATPHIFPFKWLAALPELAIHRQTIDIAGMRRSVQQLIDVEQQEFGDQLQVALQDASRANDQVDLLGAVDWCIHLAESRRFL